MVDKKALKDAGKKWVNKTVKSMKKINKSMLDPLGVKEFVSNYKKSKRKSKVSKSRMAQRTGNKYMVDKGTTYVKPKAKVARNLAPVKPTPKRKGTPRNLAPVKPTPKYIPIPKGDSPKYKRPIGKPTPEQLKQLPKPSRFLKTKPKKPSSSESANTKKQRQLRKLHQLNRLKNTRK
jgi:hypothetical protein